MKKEISLVNKHHALLVFPIKNKKKPLSLWQALYPRSEMRWEWSEDADNRVVKLWHMKEQLSRSGEVVYTKWYQGRATLFSKELFTYMLAYYQSALIYQDVLNGKYGHEMRAILEAVDMDSPLSTKQVKEACGLQGKFLEGQFNRTTKFLWNNLCLVAFGEIEDSSFPSLGYASPRVIFENCWLEAQSIDSDKARKGIEKILVAQPDFLSKVLALPSKK